MLERLEGTFFGHQDLELFFQTWRSGLPRGTVIMTHGLGEHSEYYHRLATFLVEDNWQVMGWDLRGHGRSEGKRGYANDFSQLSEDLICFIDFIKSKHHPIGKPIVLFGHSMGGCIVLKTMLDRPPQNISAIALSSPALGVSVELPAWKEFGASALAEWLPKVTLFNEIEHKNLHRDPELLREYKVDPLRHDKISPRLYTGLMAAMKEISEKATEFHWPVIMQIAGKEKVVSTPDSEKIFTKLGSKKKILYIYPESLHEIFNDIERDLALRDLKNFLNANT